MALVELDRLKEAKTLAEQYSSIAAFADIGYAKSYVDMPRSLVLATLGQVEAAEAMADKVVELFESLGIAGLNLATAHEFRARVALEAQDQNAFENTPRSPEPWAAVVGSPAARDTRCWSSEPAAWT